MSSGEYLSNEWEEMGATDYGQTSEPSKRKSERIQKNQANQECIHNRNSKFLEKSSMQSQNMVMDTESQREELGRKKNSEYLSNEWEDMGATDYSQTSEPSKRKSESVQQKQASQEFIHNRNSEFHVKSSMPSQNMEMDTENQREEQGRKRNDLYDNNRHHNAENINVFHNTAENRNQTNQTQNQENFSNQKIGSQIPMQPLMSRQNVEIEAKRKREEQARALLRDENGKRLKSISGSIEIEKAEVNRNNVKKYTELFCKRFKWARQQDLSKIMSINDMDWSYMRTCKMTMVSDQVQMPNKLRVALINVELLSPDVFKFSIYSFRREIDNIESFWSSLFGGQKDPAFGELCKLFDYNIENLLAFLLNEAANN